MAFPQPKLYFIESKSRNALNSMLRKAAYLGIFCWSGLTGGIYFHTTKGKALFIYKDVTEHITITEQEMNKPAFDKWYRLNFMKGM